MLVKLVVALVALLLLTAVLAPFEAMGWWAGWTHADAAEEAPEPADDVADPAGPAEHYVVYLSGIGAISGTSTPEEEVRFLDLLDPPLPGARLIRDVFPYSVTSMGLNGQRAFGGLWRAIEGVRLRNPDALLPFRINVRNTCQVVVSADPRYGPVYNLGVAREGSTRAD